MYEVIKTFKPQKVMKTFKPPKSAAAVAVVVEGEER
jgi:hypothetical protein